uniref:ribosomal protein S13 n=1 Tax=Meteora sporadica TaxID=2913902 RepID=UPI00300267BC|nr:ribosomal protein S13 [Meteora sporadica]WVH37099.1 ribosomal protein S13 [Meteora sporadica]
MSKVLVSGKPLSNSQNLNYALKIILGIGQANSNYICTKLGVSPNIKVKDFIQLPSVHNTENDNLEQLKLIIRNHCVCEAELNKYLQDDIKHLYDIKSYRGMRHKLGLPVNGQRTHTNSQTQRKLGRRLSSLENNSKVSKTKRFFTQRKKKFRFGSNDSKKQVQLKIKKT